MENEEKIFSLNDLIESAGASLSDDDEQPAFTFAYRHAKTDEIVGYFDFRTLTAPVNRKFQDIYSGTLKKKPNRGEATKFLFEKCCIRFRLADDKAKLELGKWANGKALFLNEPKLEMVIEMAVNEYLGEAKPNIEDVKK